MTGHVQTQRQVKLGAASRWLATHTVRLAVTAWLGACGLTIVFTVAKEPYCFPEDDATSLVQTAIDTGSSCIVQRTGIGASLLALYVHFALTYATQLTRNDQTRIVRSLHHDPQDHRAVPSTYFWRGERVASAALRAILP